MTKKIGNIVIIEAEEFDYCTRCGKHDELRPYGKNGARVCFECGMSDKEEMNRQMAKLFSDNRR